MHLSPPAYRCRHTEGGREKVDRMFRGYTVLLGGVQRIETTDRILITFTIEAGQSPPWTGIRKNCFAESDYEMEGQSMVRGDCFHKLFSGLLAKRESIGMSKRAGGPIVL